MHAQVVPIYGAETGSGEGKAVGYFWYCGTCDCMDDWMQEEGQAQRSAAYHNHAKH